jgi:hypothetical protein
MEKIEIDLDYLRYPIFLCDVETGELFTGIESIDKNKNIKKLNKKIGSMYNNYYKYDSITQRIYFDSDKYLKEKNNILKLINELINELNKVNNGQYIVINRIKDL